MKESYIEYVFDDPALRTFMMPAVSIKEPLNNGFNNQNGQNNINNQSNFIDPQEGFLRGNMERGTYIPYKNMTYMKPVITNERQRDLYKIQEVGFAAHDINLYLDTHPSDANAIKLYNQYLNMERRLNDEYERKYGPIDLSDTEGLGLTPWAWIKEPWPWMK